MVISDDAAAFLRTLCDIRCEGRIVGEDEVRRVMSALCREQRSADDDGERGSPSPPRAYREGHDDEYEIMVQMEYLKRHDWDDDQAREIMPDLARFARGLCAPLAVPLKSSGSGTVCCDMTELGRRLRSELGVSLVEADGTALPFSLRLDTAGSARAGDGDLHKRGPRVDTDEHSLLRLLTAFRRHNAKGLPLFIDEPGVAAGGAGCGDAGLLKSFECCVCLQIMKDPASLSCGHSACLRSVRARRPPASLGSAPPRAVSAHHTWTRTE